MQDAGVYQSLRDMQIGLFGVGEHLFSVDIIISMVLQ